MRTPTLAFLAVACIVAVGCVITTHHTIDAHVTVDIRHVDEQAEDIVSYVTGETDSLPSTAAKPAPEKKPEKTSSLERAVDSLMLVQVAYAADLKESSPKVKELADRMRTRNRDLQALKSTGAIGENNRGYVELLPDAEFKDSAAKNAAQRLTAAENQDRKALYTEIAELNKDQGVTLSVVEKIFAEKWRNQARSGEHIQAPSKGPDFDKFAKSPAGSDAQPDAWITVK